MRCIIFQVDRVPMKPETTSMFLPTNILSEKIAHNRDSKISQNDLMEISHNWSLALKHY